MTDETKIDAGEDIAFSRAAIVESMQELSSEESKVGFRAYATSSLSLATLFTPARYSPSRRASIAESCPNAGVTALRI